MFKQVRHARACTFVILLSAVGTLYAAPSAVVTSADAPVPAADYQSIFNTYKPLTEDPKRPDKSWRAANDAVAAEPKGGMQMGGGTMAMPMGKETENVPRSEKPMSMQMPMKNGMTMSVTKEKPVKKSASKLMKMPMEKRMSMDDIPMGEKMPPMDMRKGMGK